MGAQASVEPVNTILFPYTASTTSPQPAPPQELSGRLSDCAWNHQVLGIPRPAWVHDQMGTSTGSSKRRRLEQYPEDLLPDEFYGTMQTGHASFQGFTAELPQYVGIQNEIDQIQKSLLARMPPVSQNWDFNAYLVWD